MPNRFRIEYQSKFGHKVYGNTEVATVGTEVATDEHVIPMTTTIGATGSNVPFFWSQSNFCSTLAPMSPSFGVNPTSAQL
jgi:hypothetical protein